MMAEGKGGALAIVSSAFPNSMGIGVTTEYRDNELGRRIPLAKYPVFTRLGR